MIALEITRKWKLNGTKRHFRLPIAEESGGMKNEVKYEKAPEDIREELLVAKEVEDVLPPPELLIPREETKK